MPAVQPPICEFGWKARDFQLKGVDGKTYSLKDVRGPKGTLVVFICNHCPFVKAIIDRLVEEVAELQSDGLRRHRHHAERREGLSRATRSIR